MPIGAAVRKAVTELFDIGAKKAVISLIGTLVQEGLKQEALAINKSATSQIANRAARNVLLDKKYKELLKKFEKEADKPVTGLAFASISAAVIGEVNAYPFIDRGDLMGILSGMFDTVDEAVDRRYRAYQKAVAREGLAVQALDMLNTAVGVADSWYQAYDWKPVITQLRVVLRGRLQKVEDARLAAIKAQEGRVAVRKDLRNRLRLQVAKLRKSASVFIAAQRQDTAGQYLAGKAELHLKCLSSQMALLKRAQENLRRRGTTLYKGKIYRTDNRYHLMLEGARLEKEMKETRTRLKSAKTESNTRKNTFDAQESALVDQLQRIHELDYQLYQVEEELGIEQKSDDAPDRVTPRGAQLPWRTDGGYPRLRNDIYPFDRPVWAD